MNFLEFGIKQAIKYIIVFLSILLIFCLNVFNFASAKADSVDITESSVRADLISMNLNPDDYTGSSNKFITLAQYYDKENNLKTYLYGNLPYVRSGALYLNLSISIADSNNNITEYYKLYDLKSVDNDGNLYKMEVLGLQNLDYTTRRYNLHSIRNASDESIVDIKDVFIFNGISNDTIEVFYQDIETIVITDFEVHFYRYGDDFDMFGFVDSGITEYNTKYNDTWYVFFNTDRQLKNLVSATITYQKYDFSLTNQQTTMKSNYTEEVVLNEIEKQNNLFVGLVKPESNFIKYDSDKKVTIDSGTKRVYTHSKNFFGNYISEFEVLDNILDLKKYKAQDSDNFIFTDFANKYNWGVHFLDTEFCNQKNGAYDYVLTGSGVKRTAILSLTYIENGIRKNVYAVSEPTDFFTGSGAGDKGNELDKYFKQFEGMFDSIMNILSFVLLVFILYLLSPIIKPLLSLFVFVITLPFKTIKSLFKRKK